MVLKGPDGNFSGCIQCASYVVVVKLVFVESGTLDQVQLHADP